MSKALLTLTEFENQWPCFRADGSFKFNGVIDGQQNLKLRTLSASALNINNTKSIQKTNQGFILVAYKNDNNKFVLMSLLNNGFPPLQAGYQKNPVSTKTWNDYYTSTGRVSLNADNVIAMYGFDNILHLIIKQGSIYYDVYEYRSRGVGQNNWISENTWTLHNDYAINGVFYTFVLKKAGSRTATVIAYVVHTGTQIKIFKFAEGTNHTNRMTTAPAATYTFDHTATAINDMLIDEYFKQIVVFKPGGYDILQFDSVSNNIISGSITKGTDSRFFNIKNAIVSYWDNYWLVLQQNTTNNIKTVTAKLAQLTSANIDIELTIIAGGGGGGAGFSNSGHFIAGGGGGGADIKTIQLSLPTGTSIQCVIGSGGVGGLTTGGGDGDNSTVTINGTTYTALGGKGASNGHGGNSGNANVATDRQTTGTYRNGGDGGGYNQSTSQGQGELLDLNPFDGTNDTITPNGYGAGGKGGSRLAGKSGDQLSTPGSNQPDGSDAGDNTGCGGGGGNNGGGTNAIGAGGDGGSGLIAIKYLNSRAKSKTNVHDGYHVKLIKSNQTFILE